MRNGEAGGLIVFGLANIWLFGREFSDRTVKDLLALPVARTTIVIAKTVLGATGSLALIAETVALTLALGCLLQLPGWTAGTAVRGIGTIFVAGILTIALTEIYALVASISRGYLPAAGVMFARCSLRRSSRHWVTARGFHGRCPHCSAV